jgi:hypothetical protein
MDQNESSLGKNKSGYGEPVKDTNQATEEQQELEPVDLIYLNIKASLISISSKINNTSGKCSRSEKLRRGNLYL